MQKGRRFIQVQKSTKGILWKTRKGGSEIVLDKDRERAVRMPNAVEGKTIVLRSV
jgi:hypothetical protein